MGRSAGGAVAAQPSRPSCPPVGGSTPRLRLPAAMSETHACADHALSAVESGPSRIMQANGIPVSDHERIRTLVKQWILANASKAAEGGGNQGSVSEQPPGVPFPLTLHGRVGSASRLLVARCTPDELETQRLQRVQTAAASDQLSRSTGRALRSLCRSPTACRQVSASAREPSGPTGWSARSKPRPGAPGQSEPPRVCERAH